MSIEPKRCEDIWITLNYQYKDSPVKERRKLLEQFNPAAFTYYQTLYLALPEDIKNDLSLAVPLVYREEDELAGLVLFEHNLPPLLGLPTNQLRAPSLAYGVSVAFLHQNPAILDELHDFIPRHVKEQVNISRARLADMVANMLGSVLIFNVQAFKNALLRIQKTFIKSSEASLAQAEDLFAGTEIFQQIFQPLLDTDGATQDTPKRDSAVIQFLLSRDTKISSLGGISFPEFMRACAQVTPEKIELKKSEIVMNKPDLAGFSQGYLERHLNGIRPALPSASIAPLSFSSPLELDLPTDLDGSLLLVEMLELIGQFGQDCWYEIWEFFDVLLNFVS